MNYNWRTIPRDDYASRGSPSWEIDKAMKNIIHKIWLQIDKLYIYSAKFGSK